MSKYVLLFAYLGEKTFLKSCTFFVLQELQVPYHKGVFFPEVELTILIDICHYKRFSHFIKKCFGT